MTTVPWSRCRFPPADDGEPAISLRKGRAKITDEQGNVQRYWLAGPVEYGDLDGDGRDEAALWFGTSGDYGASGWIDVYSLDAGRTQRVGTIRPGGDIVSGTLRVAGRRIHFEVVRDRSAMPEGKVGLERVHGTAISWSLKGGKLVEARPAGQR